MNRSNINFKFNAASKNPTKVAQHLESLRGGFPGLFADIDISQLELDTGAVNILTSACRVIHEVITAYQKNSNAPLYLGLGEAHDNPAHQIHHMLVLKGLIYEGFDITLGFERYENDSIENLKTYLTVDGNPDDIDLLIKTYIDNNSNIITTHSLLALSAIESPYTLQMLKHYVAQQQRHITSFLTDAPNDDTYILTNQLPPDHKYHNHKDAILACGKTGMGIRNAYSLKKLSQGYEIHTTINTSNQPNIIMDMSGIAHQHDFKERRSKGKLAMIAEEYPGWIAIGHSCDSFPKLNGAIPKNLLITDNLPHDTFKRGNLFLDDIFTEILPKLNAPDTWALNVPAHDNNDNNKLQKHIYDVNTCLNVLGLGHVIPDDPIGTYNKYCDDWEENKTALENYIRKGLIDLEVKRQRGSTQQQNTALNPLKSP